MSNDEIPLLGGNTNASVVRVGDTVRRAATPHSQTIHRFLQHLERKRFDAAPRSFGQDAQGRDIQSFLNGTADWPDDLLTSDAPLDAAIDLLKAFHDASATYLRRTDDTWARSDPHCQEVICHNDFAPYNMLFENGLPAQIVDFDLIGPGPRCRDLAYLAYWMTPLSFGEGDLADATKMQRQLGYPRLKRLMQRYPVCSTTTLLSQVQSVLNLLGDEAACSQMVGEVAAQALAAGGHFAFWRAEAAGFRDNLSHVLDAIG